MIKTAVETPNQILKTADCMNSKPNNQHAADCKNPKPYI